MNEWWNEGIPYCFSWAIRKRKFQSFVRFKFSLSVKYNFSKTPISDFILELKKINRNVSDQNQTETISFVPTPTFLEVFLFNVLSVQFYPWFFFLKIKEQWVRRSKLNFNCKLSLTDLDIKCNKTRKQFPENTSKSTPETQKCLQIFKQSHSETT